MIRSLEEIEHSFDSHDGEFVFFFLQSFYSQLSRKRAKVTSDSEVDRHRNVFTGE